MPFIQSDNFSKKSMNKTPRINPSAEVIIPDEFTILGRISIETAPKIIPAAKCWNEDMIFGFGR